MGFTGVVKDKNGVKRFLTKKRPNNFDLDPNSMHCPEYSFYWAISVKMAQSSETRIREPVGLADLESAVNTWTVSMRHRRIWHL